MKETVVFYGTRQAADYWARERSMNPRDIVMATNPQALRGRTGTVRKVRESGWLPRGANALNADLSDEYAGVLVATCRGQITEEWA